VSPAAGVLARLPSIGLADLLDAAELQTRIDRKYLVDQADLGCLLGGAPGELAVLEIDGGRRFAYESVYFDTPELASYRGAAHSRRHRFKVRTRTYLDSGRCLLEIKRRTNRSTVKHRFDYHVVDRYRLTPAACHRIEVSGQVPAGAARLAPMLVTSYGRTTVLHVPSTTRITCDTGLRFQDGSGREWEMDPRLAVVEVKSERGAGELDRRLWRSGYRPSAISKYGVGMAVMNPHLPANKWNRTLRRYFGWRPDPVAGRRRGQLGLST
jgi:hypothetical protein